MRPQTRPVLAMALVAAVGLGSGCRHPIPIVANFQGAAEVGARAHVDGELAVRLPAAVDLGPIVASVVEPSRSGQASARIAMIDVDGLILNQNPDGAILGGENPVAAFREKLEAAASQPGLKAVVLRIDSPGGSVTACDILAAELDRFRATTGVPIVACLMEVATSGALYVAIGADRIVASPTSITGGVGVIFNHVNLEDAMAQLNVTTQAVKAGDRIDMGSVTRPLDPESESMLKQMADGFHQRFLDRLQQRRPRISAENLNLLSDGRIVAANRALSMNLVDRTGYLQDALADARSISGASDADVVLMHRAELPARSLYAKAPAPPRLSDAIPLSYPGLDRSKLPTFLYLWQPDPTVVRNRPQ